MRAPPLLLVAPLVAAVAASGCGEDALSTVRPLARVTPEAIVLGDTPVGVVARSSVRIEALSSAPLTVRAVTALGPDGRPAPDLAVPFDPPLPRTVAAGMPLDFDLVHLPSDDVLDEGSLRIETDDAEQALRALPITHAWTGGPRVAVVPELERADAEADAAGGLRSELARVELGLVPAGTRRSLPAWLVNAGRGGRPLRVESVALAAPVEGLELAAAPTPGPVFLPALGLASQRAAVRAIELTVRWTPPRPGTRLEALLVVETSDPERPRLELPITGESPGGDPGLLRVAPPAVDFGEVERAATATRSLELSNEGTGPLRVEPVVLDDATGAFRLLEPPAARELAPGDRRTLRVAFTPTATGAYAAELRIASDDPSRMAPVVVPLQGRGTIVPRCDAGPGEPDDSSCPGATDRGRVVLSGNQAATVPWSGPGLEVGGDEDWSRVTVNVAAGCTLVGYTLRARVTGLGGATADVCLRVGDCAAPERETCARAPGPVSLTLFPAGRLCNDFMNELPVQVVVRQVGGPPLCTAYQVELTAR